MQVLAIVQSVLDSLLAFVIRIGLWIFIAAFAPSWLAVLFLIAIVLIPVFQVVLDDIAYVYRPVADVALTVAAALSVHQFLDWKPSLLLTALFALPLVWNEYV